MESPLIYKKAEHLLSKVTWGASADKGWVYCGNSEDLNTNLLSECISKHFSTDNVYFIPNRRDARMITVSQIIPLVSEYIDANDITFWSEDFSSVIAFNKNGVCRCGHVFGQALL